MKKLIFLITLTSYVVMGQSALSQTETSKAKELKENTQQETKPAVDVPPPPMSEEQQKVFEATVKKMAEDALTEAIQEKASGAVEASIPQVEPVSASPTDGEAVGPDGEALLTEPNSGEEQVSAEDEGDESDPLIGPAKASTNPALLEKVKSHKVHATMITSMGTIKFLLFSEKMPYSVSNFVALAMGEKVFVEKSGKRVMRPFYNGLNFHKVIPGHFVAGGCPFGNGKGGPGFTIRDESHRDIAFDKPGLLAFANYGKGTSGSQFFIALKSEPQWAGFNIIGKVISGMNVVHAISRVPINGLNRPLNPVIIKDVQISFD